MDAHEQHRENYQEQITNKMPEKFKEFLNNLYAELKEQFDAETTIDPIRAVISAYKELDRMFIVEPFEYVSCKKGCSYCCHIDVETSDFEVALIAKYCEDNNIAINKSYLQKQLEYGERELASSPHSACIFLKDHTCSIYPVRPSTCRKYFVVSDPQLCDTHKYKNGGVVMAINHLTEVICAVIHDGSNKQGRLAELLLPYAK